MILIDLKELTHIFMERGELGFIMGGHYELYNRLFRHFFDNLSKTDAKLVFFMAGFKNTDDLQFFVPRREEDYAYHLDVLDKIESRCDMKALVDNTRNLQHLSNVRMSVSFDHNLMRLARRYGELRVNFFRHNQEIARFANDHADQVLAIITNDTDFLAFEGDFQFWRAHGIRKRELECKRYCKIKLRERLGLNVYQMQLLSALCGSHYLPIYVITDFINGLIAENSPQIGKIWNVSAYVKRQTLEMVKNKPVFDLKKISRDVFGEDYTPENLNSIANGLSIYQLDFQDDTEPKDAFLKFCRTHNAFIYKFIADDIFKINNIDYIDFRHYKSKPYNQLIMPILMKCCGILHKDDRSRPVQRTMCMKHAHDEPFKVTEETIIYPPSKI